MSGRRRSTNLTEEVHFVLPMDLAGRLRLHLYSEAEQRIPHGAWQKLFTRLLLEFFERKSLDLGTYFHDLPPGSRVYGPPAVVEALKSALEAQ